MKILFIYPNIVESPKDISTGLAILISVAKKLGHECELIDSTFGISDEEIEKKVTEFKPDLAAMTAASNDFEYACHISSIIKKIKPTLVLAGGFHPTISPDEVISNKYIDIVCVGEGEEAFSELLTNLEKNKPIEKINNLWVKRKNKKTNEVEIIKNEKNPLNQNLDTFPFPERKLFKYEKYLDWNHGTATFITTRGCPYLCTYCINHFLIKEYKGKGKFVRYRSIDNLFQEIKQVIKEYPQIKNIEFHDDTFTLDTNRVREFCKRYKEEIGVPFNINARVNAVDLELFKDLKEAGCVRVSIGIESGDAEIRNKILKRYMSDEQIIKTFKAARDAGLKTYSFNMVGVPYETKESIKKTIELNKKCKPDYIGVSIFTAFKGTELYDICKKEGWLKEKYSKSYFRDSNIQHPNFTIKELRKIRNSFGFKVFKGYRPIRGFIDLIDRNFSQINQYIFIRSKLMDKLNVLR